jgi:hypothetical protein
VTRDLFDTVAAPALGRKPKRTGPPTLEELEHAREVMARIIIRYGDGGEALLPIFKRLDDECAAARERGDVIGRVRKIAATTAA